MAKTRAPIHQESEASVPQVPESASRLEAPDIWRIIIAVRGCGTGLAKRQAGKMSDADQQRLREAFQKQVDVRGVLQSILDAQSDKAIAAKAAKVSESPS